MGVTILYKNFLKPDPSVSKEKDEERGFMLLSQHQHLMVNQALTMHQLFLNYWYIYPANACAYTIETAHGLFY